MRHVVICGMLGEKRPDEDAEYWVVNYSFRNQPNPDRVYFFDDPRDFRPDFFDEVNLLDCPVYTKMVYPEIPRSIAFPINEVVARCGVDYFTCSVAYMIAHALYEEVDKLTLHGLYDKHDSMEYVAHIPCVNFWVGRAMSRMDIRTSKGCLVGQPYPWQPNRYGYIKQTNEAVANRFLSAAYMGAMNVPIRIVDGCTDRTVYDPCEAATAQ